MNWEGNTQTINGGSHIEVFLIKYILLHEGDRSKYARGYVQYISAYPFTAIMYREDQIRIPKTLKTYI